ncbi:MAG: HAD family hydrolase [Lachnospiraceae bacterium]|jgi:HAD superfamily hydrolase (TIGR01509 family)
MIENKKAMLFDLDGTLVDSMWMWKDLDIQYLKTIGRTLPETLQSEIEGMSFTETAHYFKKRFDIPESIEEIKEIWLSMAKHKYQNEVPLKRGAYEFLEYLNRHDYKVGICSSNSIDLIQAVLEAHGVLGFIHQIRTCCEVKRGKPAPDIYLKVAEDLQTDPCDCLVFEDIVPGILAGKNANMTTCAVEDAYSIYQREEKKRIADYYIQDYFDILHNL